MAAQARGAVELMDDQANVAVGPLRRAFELWQEIGAPYAAARVRVLIGLACRALEDEDGAELELSAARSMFQHLGASPDIDFVDRLAKEAAQPLPHRLTPRELQVLRLITTGKTNKAIAAELSLSEKTIDRHVSNMFTKLDVPSRAAATALAYELKLI
jgi:DNA-binding NarL/FixJ family response regulator